MLKPGTSAPEVELPDQDGRPFRLSDLRGKGPVVLFFYPKDETWVCTREACGFRNGHAAFLAAGATVVGISADPPAAHRAFIGHHRLPFTLLSDADDAAYAAFGLRRVLGMKQRVTFVLDAQGVVQAAISGRFHAAKHVRRALATVRDQGLARS